MCNLLRLASGEIAGMHSEKPLEEKLHASKDIQPHLGLRPLADSPVIIHDE
jgi:hypothetical protein